MGITNINIDFNALKGEILGALGLSDSGSKYPTTLPGNIKIDQITNQPKYNDDNWRKSRGYSFRVVRVKNGKEVRNGAKNWQEFRLQINPQELSQEEIFAIEVTPTFRGVVVEHHGTILKDITISGTTGISPFRKEAGASQNSGAPILSSGHSGYKEFHELRSYFRTYVEQKRIDARDNGELRMIFCNYKDEEYLYVEPQRFSMKRSAAKPFMYDYSISLKGIGNATGERPPSGYLQTLEDTIDSIQGYLDLGYKVVNGSVAVIARFERDIYDTILNPIRSLSRALLAIRGGGAQLLGDFNITRQSVSSLQGELRRVQGNWKDIIGQTELDDIYDKSMGRIATLKGKKKPLTANEVGMANALKKLEQATIMTLADRRLFDQNQTDQNRRVEQIYDSQISIQDASSVRSTEIIEGDTIHTIATREMGSPDFFKEIVMLNGLKPPYILEAGQKIYIPQEIASEPTNITSNGRDYLITAGMSETEKNMGVDIRVDQNNDLALSNTGDLDLIAGVDNMVQAIGVKLKLEPGSLKRHIGIGTGLVVGQKITANVLSETRLRLISSLSSDPRIESLPYVELKQEGSTTLINMIIKLRSLDEPIPASIAVNG